MSKFIIKNYKNLDFRKKADFDSYSSRRFVEVTKLIGLDISGVDILFDHNDFMVCEINSYPGFERFEKATGLNIPGEIFNYIKLRLKNA